MLQCVAEAIIWAERRAREIGSWLKQHKEVKAHWGAVVLADTQAVWNAHLAPSKAWVAIDDIDFSWADSVKVQGTPLMKSVAQNSCSWLT